MESADLIWKPTSSYNEGSWELLQLWALFTRSLQTSGKFCKSGRLHSRGSQGKQEEAEWRLNENVCWVDKGRQHSDPQILQALLFPQAGTIPQTLLQPREGFMSARGHYQRVQYMCPVSTWTEPSVTEELRFLLKYH